jgi:putative oxidoreductase
MSTIVKTLSTPSNIKAIATTVVRSILGLIYFVFGLNFFLHFIPMPPPPAHPGAAESFTGGLFQAGYFFPMLKGIEALLGGFLLLNFFTPLSLVILAPISINILLFHLFLAPAGIGMGVLIVLLHAYMFWAYRKNYKTILDPKVLLT